MIDNLASPSEQALSGEDPREAGGVRDSERELVILIHGLGAKAWMMHLLERRLRRLGFQTRAWGYRSVGSTVEKVAARFQEFLRRQATLNPQRPMHIVAHSMGGIVTRRVLLDDRIENLKRVVLLAPPNAGSHAARYLGPWLKWLSPALSQLSDATDSFVVDLEPPRGGEWGIVAAQYDRVVPVDSTRLTIARDHVVLPTGHMRLLLRRDTASHVGRFLTEGEFGEKTTSPVAVNVAAK